MAKISWSNLALDDLRDIFDYVAQDSERYADRLMDKIIRRVDMLTVFPKMGRVVPEFEDEKIRELIEGNYRIIYKINPEGNIGIARVHHSTRNLEEL